MSIERYKSIKIKEHKEIVENCPIRVDKSQLLFDTQNNQIVLQIKMQIISDKPIKSVCLEVECYNENSKFIETQTDIVYKIQDVKKNEYFGDRQPIILESLNITDLKILIERVRYDDNTVWVNETRNFGIDKNLEEEIQRQRLIEEEQKLEKIKRRKIIKKKIIIAICSLIIVFLIILGCRLINNNIEKKEVITKVYSYWDTAEDYKNSTIESTKDLWESAAIDTVAACIGYSEKSEMAGCKDKVDILRKEVSQELANEGIDVKAALKNMLENENNKTNFNPLNNKEGKLQVLNQIELISNDISEEKIREVQFEKSPLIITDIDTYNDGDYWYCTGTVSNLSDKKYNYYNIEVQVTYYDIHNIILDKNWTFAVGNEFLMPGESKQFEVRSLVKGDIKYNKVIIRDYKYL